MTLSSPSIKVCEKSLESELQLFPGVPSNEGGSFLYPSHNVPTLVSRPAAVPPPCTHGTPESPQIQGSRHRPTNPRRWRVPEGSQMKLAPSRLQRHSLSVTNPTAPGWLALRYNTWKQWFSVAAWSSLSPPLPSAAHPLSKQICFSMRWLLASRF